MRIYKSLALTLACFFSASSLQAATVTGEPVLRSRGKVGCSFTCPAGVVQIHEVTMRYRLESLTIPVSQDDGGILICAGERRSVGRVTPALLHVTASLLQAGGECSVTYTNFTGSNGDDVAICNNEKLEVCLKYGGGDACFDKWCD